MRLQRDAKGIIDLIDIGQDILMLQSSYFNA